MSAGVSFSRFIGAGVPKSAARTLRLEARTLTHFVARGRLSRDSALKHITRLAQRLAGDRAL